MFEYKIKTRVFFLQENRSPQWPQENGGEGGGGAFIIAGNKRDLQNVGSAKLWPVKAEALAEPNLG